MLPVEKYPLPADGVSLYGLIAEIEESLLCQALHRCNGNRTHAAALLGLNRTTLVAMLKRYKLFDDPRANPDMAH